MAFFLIPAPNTKLPTYLLKDRSQHQQDDQSPDGTKVSDISSLLLATNGTIPILHLIKQ